MSTELLTDEERETISLAGRVYSNIKRMCGESSTRNSDLTEAAAHCHALQQMVMAQAAARAYPDEFRLLGETHDELICGHVGPFTADDGKSIRCQLRTHKSDTHIRESDGHTYSWPTYD